VGRDAVERLLGHVDDGEVGQVEPCGDGEPAGRTLEDPEAHEALDVPVDQPDLTEVTGLGPAVERDDEDAGTVGLLLHERCAARVPPGQRLERGLGDDGGRGRARALPGPPRAAGPADDRPDPRQQADNLEASLRRNRLALNALNNHESQAYVTLRLFDEISFPVANNKVNFVNMPGVEVGLLRLENPRAGLSANAYRGYSIKYLFTRGKSYVNLGIYKPLTANANPRDSAFVNELAVINFGQDFYPRNFGRGRRRYLNLYTCYQIGGFIANRNQESRNEFVFNINPGLGLELIKTKHILLDTKVSYFVPLNRESRNLRGLLVQGAFNFVF